MFVLSTNPQETASHRSDTAGAGPHLLGMTGLRALLSSSLMELTEPISGAIHDSQQERVAALADKPDSHSTTSDQLYTDPGCSASAGSD